MNRRGFLATAGAVVVAGCSGGEGNSTPTSSGADEPGSGPEEPTPGPDAEAAIGRLTDGPSVVECQHVPLTVSSYGRRIRVPDRLSAVASFVEPATGDTPARLEAVFTNGTEYEQTVRAGAFPILDDPSLGRTEGGEHRVAYLAPTEAHELAESVPTPERDGEGRWRLGDDGLSGRWFPETVTIGPESAVFGEYVLLGHPDRSEPPVSPGRYRLGSRNAEFTVAVWRTDAPGPENGSRFEGESVPPLPSAESGPMRWYHEADTGTAAYLEPSAERVSTPAEVRFRQVNHADESLQGNPYKWALSKLVGGEWLRVAPWETPQPWSVVQPGAVDLSGLRLFHGSGFDGVDGADTGGARTVPYVGGGRYAYRVDYSREDETHAALLDVEAPQLDVGPTADLTVERDGATVIARSPRRAKARRPATLTVERVDAGNGRRVIDEQLPRRRNRGLRNTLTLFEAGIERVELRTDRSTALGPVGFESGGRRTIRYEGETFEVVGTLDDG